MSDLGDRVGGVGAGGLPLENGVQEVLKVTALLPHSPSQPSL